MTEVTGASRQQQYTPDSEVTVELSIILPAFNEADNVEPLTGEIINTLENDVELSGNYEIVFVNDGSTDGTGNKLRDLALNFPNLKVISLQRNFGQSAALAAGVDHSSGNVIITMDADGQNDPSDIPALLDRLDDGYDCVSGWRKQRRDPLTKRIPSRIQTWLAGWTGPEIHDFGCTLKAYRRESIEGMDLYGEGHRYIPARLYRQGYSVTEIPVNHRPRENGESKYGAARLVKGFLDLLFNIFWNRFGSRPIHFVGGLGLLFMFIGGLIGMHAIAIKYTFGIPLAPRTPRLILVIGFIIFGFQLLMFGFLAEMITKIYYKRSIPYRVSEIIE